MPTWSKTENGTKNNFSRNLIATIPDLTTNLVFLVVSSNSKTIALLGSGYSGRKMLKRAWEISLKLYKPGSNSYVTKLELYSSNTNLISSSTRSTSVLG